MKFVEVNEGIFVNLDNVSSVTLKKSQQDSGDVFYYWVFIASDDVFTSQIFKSEGEAREWLFNLY